MVRLFDYLQRYGQYFLFALLLIFATRAFFTDACAIAEQGSTDWSSRYWRWMADSAYRAAQLFVLEFNRNCSNPTLSAEVSWQLEIARYSALLFIAAAAVTFFIPRTAQWLLIGMQALGRGRRAIVLGYGPVGQCIARELTARPRARTVEKVPRFWGHILFWLLSFRLIAAADHWWRRGRFVTALHKGVTQPLIEVAKRDNILLVEGDPSDPRLHRHVRINRSSCVFAAVGSDMQTLDAAVSARKSLTRNEHPIRAILSDPDLAANLSEAAPLGFLGATDVRGFSLATEAARLLIAEARFDRIAIEKKQSHVHLLIVGCGAQGEAVAMETLLTAWRTRLGAPVVSIVDRNCGLVRERFRRRAPAAFPEGEPELPQAARIQINFEYADIESLDFTGDATLGTLLARYGPATAWVFAAGDDSLNLRGAAQLHLAILKKQIAPAPIYVRIWSGHQGDTPVLAAHPVGLAHAFGALEATLAATPACEELPDAIAEELHATYLRQGLQMNQADRNFTFTDLPWGELPETQRKANRRLHRHAVMKFEDLGGQWRQRRRAVPVVDAELRETYVAAEDRIDYNAVNSDELPQKWWRDSASIGESVVDDLTSRAEAILKVAITEHNRWTIDRTLDGWRPTNVPHQAARDDIRRHHPNMCDWSLLDANTRRWDAVLLRTLMVGQEGRDLTVSAWRHRVSSVVLAIRTEKSSAASGVPEFLPNCRFVASPEAAPLDTLPTELHLAIAGEPRRVDLDKTIESACEAFARLSDQSNLTSRLCRVRFDFFEPPGEGMLAVANALGAMVAKWKQVAGDAPIEVSSLWHWGETRAPVIGFVGHRNMERLQGSSGLAQYLEQFFAARLAGGQVSGLVSGYAPGADRIAVNSWIALGGQKPLLFFPFSHPVEEHWVGSNQIYLTDSDVAEGSADWINHRDIVEFAAVRSSRKRSDMDPHGSQASDILESADIIVAVYDGTGSSGRGSVGETVDRANAMDKQVIVIDRGENGAWRHHDLKQVRNRKNK